MGDNSNIGVQQLVVTVHGDKLREDAHSLEIRIRHDLTIYLLHKYGPFIGRNGLEDRNVIFIVTAHPSNENEISPRLRIVPGKLLMKVDAPESLEDINLNKFNSNNR
ncbi:hypothetical protein DX130_04355 [Paenibacillus paeoniae]|uniref:Uncharacterized protein n=1 Tax=Paenibacillus paeoniae TaxID=2292705 RepID=A0A371PK26_9BACL|nr:hypothetical protein DX130_04355 [Paenibacillus paeoniae]